jgi:hypothetical protein
MALQFPTFLSFGTKALKDNKPLDKCPLNIVYCYPKEGN